MLRINKLQQILLFLIFLFLPFQFGKHFWPSFAFVEGQRVDYLSPTIYVSDVVIIVLFLFTFFRKQLRFGRLGLLGLLGIVLYLSLGIFLSASPLNGWYTLVKLLELAFLGWYVARQKESVTPFLFWSFSIGVVIEGILGIFQFLHQGSIGGLWYFLGERTFSAVTPGIANASIHGQLVLRPYATFSHPNVFAGYVVITLLFFLTYLFSKNTMEQWNNGAMEKIKIILSACILAFGFIILFFTLSRVAIVVFIFLALTFLIRKFSKLIWRILFGICILGFVILFTMPLLAGRFFDVQGYIESFALRDILMQSSWNMFLSHPIFGVGLGNFLPSLPLYLSSKVLFGFLQPAHNIFLFVLSETGIVGLGIFVAILVLAFAESLKKAKANPPFSFPFYALLAICLIGLTDHYFLTLQQGQLLFAVTLGLCFYGV